jgi:hypothetical protein
LKVTVDNWSFVQERIRQFGIKDTTYDSNGALQIIISNNNERFEFSRDTLEQFQKAGLTKLGIRIERKKK